MNLLLRFVLEIAGIVGLYRIGTGLLDGGPGTALGIVIAGGAIAAWGTFNVPGDRSRSGGAPVPVTGVVRLMVEMVLLGGGAIGWWLAGPAWLAWAYTIALVPHYALSWDRLAWLLAYEPGSFAG